MAEVFVHQLGGWEWASRALAGKLQRRSAFGLRVRNKTGGLCGSGHGCCPGCAAPRAVFPGLAPECRERKGGRLVHNVCRPLV